MANVVELFKDGKKLMNIKMDQGKKLIDDAVTEFVSCVEGIVEEMSEEDLQRFLVEEHDELLSFDDKLFMIAAFEETHDVRIAHKYVGLSIAVDDKRHRGEHHCDHCGK